jgi:hypothetical protein
MPVPMAVMPATMRDLFQPDLVIAFEDSRIRLVQFVENSVALGNTGNRPARPGYARNRHGADDAQHSSEKQPTFHQKPPELLTIGTSFPRPNRLQRQCRSD